MKWRRYLATDQEYATLHDLKTMYYDLSLKNRDVRMIGSPSRRRLQKMAVKCAASLTWVRNTTEADVEKSRRLGHFGWDAVFDNCQKISSL